MTREDLQQIAELMDTKLGPVYEKLDSMDERLDSMDEYARQTRVLMEKQEHNVALIAEQYGDISLKLERVRELDELRDRVRTLETVVRSHSAKLQGLGRAE